MKKGFLLLSVLAMAISGVAHANDTAIRQALGKLGLSNIEIQNAPVVGLKMVISDGGVLYVSDDGKHLIQGPLFDISSGQPVNVTNNLLMGKLNALDKEMIIYKAAQEKHVITVFTDITCGYCHKLHQQMDDYNALGITVRYLAFPRQGLDSPAEAEMKSIWCAKDRNKAFDAAMKGDSVAAASCNINITQHYALGVQFGIQGTPAIVLQDGTMIPGYQGPKEMKAFLDKQQGQKKAASGQ